MRKKNTILELQEKVSLYRRILDLTRKLRAKKTLYQVIFGSLGTEASPRDQAPDEVACAETATEIIRQVAPEVPIMLGTWTLWDYMERSPRFKRTTVIKPGTIIISPTGTSALRPAPFPGHVGFFLNEENIASNTSATGIFEHNYTLKKWQERWVVKGKYPVYYYDLV